MSERAQTDIVLFTSSSPEDWSLTRRGIEPWMCLAVARTDNDTVVATIDTNDAMKVKGYLYSNKDTLYIKSIHIVAPTNNGVTVAEVLDFIEAKLDGDVMFHYLQTTFGTTQIDGPVQIPPHQVEKCTFTSLYNSLSGKADLMGTSHEQAD